MKMSIKRPTSRNFLNAYEKGLIAGISGAGVETNPYYYARFRNGGAPAFTYYKYWLAGYQDGQDRSKTNV